MHGGPKRLLHEAMKMKPGLCWRPQDIGGARDMGCLPETAASRGWNQPGRQKCIVVNRIGRAEPSELFGIRQGIIGSGFSLAHFLHYDPIPAFWNGNMNSVPL